MQKLVSGLQIQGNLQNIALTFPAEASDWHHLLAAAKVEGITIKSQHQYPGVENLSGNLKWNGETGSFVLNSKQLKLEYDAIFLRPILLDQASGEVQISKGDSAWQLAIPALHLLNKDITANVNGTISLPEKGSPTLDIKGNFALQKANHITKYLPTKVFEPNLVEWLQEAFFAGEVKSGELVVHGSLADFPFDHDTGEFIISGVVSNIDFRYAPDWPILKKINGHILFSGRKIAIDVDHAWILDIPVGKVHAEIPYLGDAKPQVVNVETSEIQTDVAEGLKVIDASPLEKTIGKVFKGMNVHGPMSLKLGLIVPLANPDKTTVKGDVEIKNAVLDLTPWNLQVDNLNGSLQFTESTTTSDNLMGGLFNKPVSIHLATVKQAKRQPTLSQPALAHGLRPMVRAMNDLLAEYLPTYYPKALREAMKGLRREDEIEAKYLDQVRNNPNSPFPEADVAALKGMDMLGWVPELATYMLWGTVFSTLELNRHIVFRAHEDAYNVDNTLVCIAALGSWVGGRLIFPRYGYGADLEATDLLICDNHFELHGNVGPLVGPSKSPRFSVVAFLHSNVLDYATREGQWRSRLSPAKGPATGQPRVWDCHAGRNYPADAVYVGCRVRNRKGEVLREGTIFGNGSNPLESHKGALNSESGVPRIRCRKTEESSIPGGGRETARTRLALLVCSGRQAPGGVLPCSCVAGTNQQYSRGTDERRSVLGKAARFRLGILRATLPFERGGGHAFRNG